MILVLTDIGRGDRGAQQYGFAVNIACNLVTCGLSLQSPWEMMQENPVGQGGGGKTEPTLCHFHGIGSMLECRPGKTSFYRPCCYRRTCRSPAQADYDCQKLCGNLVGRKGKRQKRNVESNYRKLFVRGALKRYRNPKHDDQETESSKWAVRWPCSAS